jgi:hypothetical protein
MKQELEHFNVNLRSWVELLIIQKSEEMLHLKLKRNDGLLRTPGCSSLFL